MAFKATVFGLALLAAVTSTYAADAPGAVLSAPGGRFAFGQIGSGRVDQYLLDTQTGKVWQMQCAKKGAEPFSCEVNVFVPLLFSESGGFVVQPTVTPSTPTATPKH